MQMNAQVVAIDGKDERDQVVLRNSISNQFVANKNFINQSNVWVDAEFSETSRLPETAIKFASDEYFSLVTREPELAQYLSLGEQVVIVWKGRVYRITK
jgi:Ca-activated chloride channel family protein